MANSSNDPRIKIDTRCPEDRVESRSQVLAIRPRAKLRAVANKADLTDWVLEALQQLGGSAEVIDVSKRVWRNHEADLVASGDLFYTWQYDLRWAAQRLRDSGRLKPSVGRRPHTTWDLA